MHLSPETLTLLFSISCIAGFIDTLAGGGGLITIPSLLLAGIPPLAALGTNKIQGVAGTATATFMLTRSKSLHWPDLRRLCFTAFIGAAAGTLVVQQIDSNVLSVVIPLVLMSIGLYFILVPIARLHGGEIAASENTYRNFVIPVIGCYDGMFGPGTGSFFTLAGVALKGKHLVQATVDAKSLNFATNLASVCVFLLSGHFVWAAGAVMMLGQFFGARLAAGYLPRINPMYLKYLIVMMSFGMMIRYASSNGWF
jgi:uncharacterized membrane protein YfcA